MANATISGNNFANGATVSNATDASGVPTQNASDVTVQLSAATVSGFGRFYDVTFAGGADTLVASNMPWVDPATGASLGFDDVIMGDGDDYVELFRSGFINLNAGAGNDTLDMETAGGSSAVMGTGDDVVRADLSGYVETSEEEQAQKDGRPLLDVDGGAGGTDTLNLVGDWTVTLDAGGSVTINDGSGDTITNEFTAQDFQNITGFPAQLSGTAQWGDATVNGLTVRHPAFTFSNFEVIEAMCFTTGTMIDTPKGPVEISTLNEGDVICTRNGPLPVRWIGKRRLDVIDLMANPKLLPIRIPAGALQNGLPLRDLVLSPQHRVVVASEIARALFGHDEVLVAAKHLVGWNGIDVDGETREVIYMHIMMDEHAIVRAEGQEAETLLPGPQAMEMMTDAALRELLEIFPDIEDVAKARDAHAALPLMKGRDSRALVARMKKSYTTCSG